MSDAYFLRKFKYLQTLATNGYKTGVEHEEGGAKRKRNRVRGERERGERGVREGA